MTELVISYNKIGKSVGQFYKLLLFKGEIFMNKKFVSLFAAAVLSIQAAVVPIIANAEASVTYITDSDFTRRICTMMSVM